MTGVMDRKYGSVILNIGKFFKPTCLFRRRGTYLVFGLSVVFTIILLKTMQDVLTDAGHMDVMQINDEHQETPFARNAKSQIGLRSSTIGLKPLNREHKEQGTPHLSTIRDRSTKDTDSALSTPLAEIKQRLETRMTHIRAVCKKRSQYSKAAYKQDWIELYPGRLSVCPVPQVGTTFLTGKLKKTIRELHNGSAPFLNAEPKRFMVVREPYGRLVSAFFSKVVGHPWWWSVLGEYVIFPNRQNMSRQEAMCAWNITFPEYVRYVIDMHRTGNGQDGHYMRILNSCNVCADTPDYVIRLEDIKEELSYILYSLNLSAILKDEFIEIQHIARLFMRNFHKLYPNKDCGPMCSVLKRFWWSQQGTGLISLDLDIPVKGSECDDMTGTKLSYLAWTAYLSSTKNINRNDQRRRIMAELFRQVPLQDRLTLKSKLFPDFELFEYDPHPDFVFPDT